MVNRVLAAYVATDFIFAATGAVMVGFCVIVQNIMFEVPTDGTQAVRNLLYQSFPLTGTTDPSRRDHSLRSVRLRRGTLEQARRDDVVSRL